MTKMTNFQLVSDMNIAFGNKKGDPTQIDWPRIRKQCANISDEVGELFIALGAPKEAVMAAVGALKASVLTVPDTHVSATHGVRDALCDINVFSYGAHHMMGLDADRDMDAVITGVMTRFIKNPEDKAQTVAKHSQAGVTEVYFEGAYPYMVMKSAVDQPDAPKGKFLKSASYRAPEFYDVVVVPNNSCADQMNQTYGEGYGTDWKYQEKGAKV